MWEVLKFIDYLFCFPKYLNKYEIFTVSYAILTREVKAEKLFSFSSLPFILKLVPNIIFVIKEMDWQKENI